MAELPEFNAFQDPPAEFRQMPFWSWNDQMSKERISEMLTQFAERGMGGAFLHARPGLITEYFSEEWWELWSHALSECRRLGLECQIYDENSFPSVFAGGHVMGCTPYVGAGRLVCCRNDSPEAACSEPVGAFVIGEDGETVLPVADAASFARAHTVARIDEEPSARMGGSPYIDILHPDATDTFIALTHQEYAKRYAEDFGSVVKYAFTDEPDLRGGDGFHWTKHLADEFRLEHGYDLTERLPEFGFGAPGCTEVRFDYWQTVNRLFVGSFAKPVYEWCEQNRLSFTGHFWDHEWPSPARQPSNMALVRWMQTPGIDLLGFQFDHRDVALSTECLLYVKEVTSVGNQLGCKRVLCEAYGGRGYDMSIRDFKPISDYLVANGVNLNSPHLSHVSIAGVRKYEWPQTLSDHSPWWDEYRMLADHDARMTYAATRGKTVNRVLLLHPTTSAWLHYVPKSFVVNAAAERDAEWMAELKRSQLSLVNLLADNAVDFDLGDEYIIEELASAADGKLLVGKCAYDVVVMPEMMENVLASTVERLCAYLSSGGILLSMGQLPRYIDGCASDAVTRLAAEFDSSWVRCTDRNELLERLKGIAPPRIAAADGAALPPHVSILRRELDGGRVLYVIVNPFEAEVSTSVSIEGNGLYALDTATGGIAAVATSAEGDRQTATLELGASGHALWLAVPSAIDAIDALDTTETEPIGESRELDVREASVERTSPNVLVLDYCDVTVDGETRRGVNVTEADTFVWQKHGFDENVWLGVQYRRSFVDRVFPEDSGFELTYGFSLSPQAFAAVSSSIEIAIERPELYTVEVNGHVVEFADASRYGDVHMRKTSIVSAVAPGWNEVTLRAKPFSIFCEVMPIRILGEFALEAAAPGFAITQPGDLRLGDWRVQGMPFYPEAVCYIFEVALEEDVPSMTVLLGDWAGSVARVYLDDEKRGAVAWPPYEMDVLGPFAAGTHVLALDVVGNMKNLMGPHFNDGLPGVWSWRMCPKAAPEGGQYRFYPSGLMTPPVVIAAPSRGTSSS